MRGLLALSVGLVAAANTFGATIDISTGVANWEVFRPGSGLGSATTLTSAQSNPGSWAGAPAGSSWVSYGSTQGTPCATAATGPANGCASTLMSSSPSGDIWTYTLTISAASLGATSGSLNFIFGGDNRVNLFIGNQGTGEDWSGQPPSSTNGTGFNPLGCSGNPPTSAGSSQATYNGCTGTVSFSAADLNGDGSLTLSAYDFNDPIANCPACGDPTGFVLEGDILTGAPAAAPEPASFGMITLAGLAGLAIRSRKRAAAR